MRKESLNTKILILTISLFVICSLMYGIFFSFQSKQALMDEFITRGNALIKNLVLNAELEILIENREGLKMLAENLLQERDVQSVTIMNDSKQVLVDVSKPGQLKKEYKETMSLYVAKTREEIISDDFAFSLQSSVQEPPEEDAEQIIGYIEVLFSKKGVIDTINTMRENMLLSAIGATIIGCIVALYFTRSIVKPIRRLASATTRIAAGSER